MLRRNSTAPIVRTPIAYANPDGWESTIEREIEGQRGQKKMRFVLDRRPGVGRGRRSLGGGGIFSRRSR